MPFQSENQRRYMHANLPEIAQRWEKDYAGGGITRLGLANGNFINMGAVANDMDPLVQLSRNWQSDNSFQAPFLNTNTMQGSVMANEFPPDMKIRDYQYPMGTDIMGMDEMESGYDTPRSAQEAANMENYIPRSMVPQKIQGGPNIHEGFGEYDKWGNIRMDLENPDKDPYQSQEGLAFLKNKLGDMWGGAKDKFGEMWGGAKDIGAQTFEGIKNIGSTAGQMAMGPVSWIGKKLDRFDQLPMADQMFISQQMGGAGQMGEGIGRDPQSGAIRDLGGKNVRSMFGNYSDAVHTEFDRYDTAIEESKDRYMKKYGSLDTENKYGKTWEEMNKRNIKMQKYYRDKKQGQQKLAADMARKEKARREALEAKQKIDTRPSTGGGGDWQGKTYTGPAFKTREGRDVKQDWSDPTDFSQSSDADLWAEGGRIGYAAGGLASLWQR